MLDFSGSESDSRACHHLKAIAVPIIPQFLEAQLSILPVYLGQDAVHVGHIEFVDAWFVAVEAMSVFDDHAVSCFLNLGRRVMLGPAGEIVLDILSHRDFLSKGANDFPPLLQ